MHLAEDREQWLGFQKIRVSSLLAQLLPNFQVGTCLMGSDSEICFTSFTKMFLYITSQNKS
jgi:hypothetical protein